MLEIKSISIAPVTNRSLACVRVEARIVSTFGPRALFQRALFQPPSIRSTWEPKVIRSAFPVDDFKHQSLSTVKHLTEAAWG